MYFEVSDQFTQSNSPFSAHPRFWSRNARVYQQKRALVAKSVWFRLSLTSPRCRLTFGDHLTTSDRIEHSNVLRWWDSVWKSNLINQFWCLAFEIGFTRPVHLKERLSNGFECAWNSTALYLDTVELHACSNTIRCRSSRWAGLVKPVLNNFDL